MKITTTLLLILFSWSIFAKDCPSKLPSGLNETDSYAWGVELRALYNGVTVDTSGTTGLNQHPFKVGIKGEFDWFISDSSTAIIEMDIKQNNKGDENPDTTGSMIRMNQLNYNYESDFISSTTGIIMHSFASSVLIDQRFIGESLILKFNKFKLGFFGGVTKRDMLRSLENGFFHPYNKVYQDWKLPISNSLDNFIFQLSFSYRALKPYKLKVYFIASLPEEETLQSNALSFMAAGPIIKGKWSFHFEGLLFQTYNSDIIPGVLLTTRVKALSWVNFNFGILSKLNSDNNLQINPVYENITWGLIKKYSINANHVAKISFDFKIKDKIHPFIRYHIQSSTLSSNDITDELDVGLEYEFKGFKNKKYFAHLAYVQMELAGDQQKHNGVQAEVRFIY